MSNVIDFREALLKKRDEEFAQRVVLPANAFQAALAEAHNLERVRKAVEAPRCDICDAQLQDNWHSDGVCGDCHDALLKEHNDV